MQPHCIHSHAQLTEQAAYYCPPSNLQLGRQCDCCLTCCGPAAAHALRWHCEQHVEHLHLGLHPQVANEVPVAVIQAGVHVKPLSLQLRPCCLHAAATATGHPIGAAAPRWHCCHPSIELRDPVAGAAACAGFAAIPAACLAVDWAASRCYCHPPLVIDVSSCLLVSPVIRLIKCIAGTTGGSSSSSRCCSPACAA